MNSFQSYKALRYVLGMYMLAACSDTSSPSNMGTDMTVFDDGVPDASVEQIDESIVSPDLGIEVDSYLTGDPCRPIVPAAATLKPGLQTDGSRLSVNGRVIGPLGTEQPLEGFPSNVLPHPTAPVVYVTSTSHDDRLLVVLDKTTLEPLQTLNPEDVYAGLALDSRHQKLYVSGGESSLIFIYAVDDDGLLTLDGTLTAAGHVNYLFLDPMTDSIWFSQWDDAVVQRINIASDLIDRRIELPSPGWQFAVTDRRLWISMLAHPQLHIINLDESDVPEPISTLGAVSDLCVLNNYMYAVISDSDGISRLDLDDPTNVTFISLGDELLDENEQPYANSNANSIICDPVENRLYVSRGSDNLISVFNALNGDELGLIPTGEYPTKLAHDSSTNTLWLSEGKGGTAPSEGRTGKRVISGFARTLNLNEVDLEQATATAKNNFIHPKTVFPFECDGFFPVPTRPDQRTPIEHIILIVKENKTFD